MTMHMTGLIFDPEIDQERWLADSTSDEFLLDDGADAPLARTWRPNRFSSVPSQSMGGLYSLDDIRSRSALKRLLQRMTRQSWTWDGSEADDVDPDAIGTALQILENLPWDRDTPQVSPDGEGGITFAWDRGMRTTLITVEGGRVHLVANPGTSDVVHIPNRKYSGGDIPEDIAELI